MGFNVEHMQKCLISNLDMALHFLLLILNALVSLFLFLKSGLQVVKDLLQLLLSGSQACSHLLCFCKQLRLCLKLLGKDVLLFQQLHIKKKIFSDGSQNTG